MNFQHTLALCTALAMSACATTETTASPDLNIDPRGTIQSEDKTFVFIGEKVAVINQEYECPEDYICMDGLYHARYRIIDIISGKYAGDTIDFFANDHNGTPKFSKPDIVMLYVRQYGEKIGHIKYTYNTVHPTKNGEWGTCDEVYEYSEIALANQIPKQLIRFSLYRDNIYFGVARCKKGYFVKDVDEIVRSEFEGRTPEGLVKGWQN